MADIKRVLVKLSGEALIAADGYWLAPATLMRLAADLAAASRAGYEIAVVIGGAILLGAPKWARPAGLTVLRLIRWACSLRS